MKTFTQFLSEKSDIITTTATGNVEIHGIKMNSSEKGKLNKKLGALYDSFKKTEFNKFLEAIENTLESLGIAIADEEYSKGYSSFDVPKGTNKEFHFTIGKLDSIVDTGKNYKPISQIYTNVDLKMFIFREGDMRRIESVYIN